MAKSGPKPKDIDVDKLMQLAYQYCDECINSTKEVATPRGPVEVKERHLPTIGYFLYHWMRKQDFEFYKYRKWYYIKEDKDHPLHDAIMEIDELFKNLARDIVGNEGKGIFYAKNYLDMHDKQVVDSSSVGTIKIVYGDNS